MCVKKININFENFLQKLFLNLRAIGLFVYLFLFSLACLFTSY